MYNNIMNEKEPGAHELILEPEIIEVSSFISATGEEWAKQDLSTDPEHARQEDAHIEEAYTIAAGLLEPLRPDYLDFVRRAEVFVNERYNRLLDVGMKEFDYFKTGSHFSRDQIFGWKEYLYRKKKELEFPRS